LGTNTHFRGTPTRSLVVDDAVEVQAGGRFTCARRANGQVFCWGENDHAQLGSRHTEPCGDAEIDSVCAPTPQRVNGLSGVQGLATGEDHACALLRAATVSCWGSNEHGQLGGSAAGDRKTPSLVAGVSGVQQVVAGDNHTCVLIGRPGRVRCWGDNEAGQAAGEGVRVTRPVTVAGLSDAVEIVGGGAHTCARRAGGSVACWGYNYLGQLGVGSTRPTSTNRPLAVRGLTDAVQLAAGRYHTCARRRTGGVACWGLNRKGEIGDGSTTDRASPTRVISINDAQFLAGGRWHFCVIRRTASVWCWGDNLGGQLGTGHVNDTANPVPVAVSGLPGR
jgi:alpha-tubulin suppressor-like RCC1 family protein